MARIIMNGGISINTEESAENITKTLAEARANRMYWVPVNNKDDAAMYINPAQVSIVADVKDPDPTEKSPVDEEDE